MEFRSITDLEQLENLPDDAQILVIDGDTAKRISKANAKFGGGSVTTFYLSQSSIVVNNADSGIAVQENIPITALYHEDGTEITAQEFYNAFAAGVLLLAGQSNVGYLGAVSKMRWVDSSGGATDPTDVVWCACPNPFSSSQGIQIGTNPTMEK